MEIYHTEISDAIKDPLYYYSNFLLNKSSSSDIEVICIDSIKFTCVYYWLYQVSIGDNQSLIEYKKRYDPELIKECSFINNEDGVEYSCLIKKCPDIRDYIYKSEREYLDSCKSIDEYMSFLKSNPRCREFELFAKYKISEIKGSRYLEYQETLRDYFNSDIFGIDNINNINNNCEYINKLPIMWIDSISEEQKNILKSILSSMLIDNDIYTSKNYIRKAEYITLLYGTKANVINKIIEDSNVFVDLSFLEIELLSNQIERFIGYKLSLPKIELLDKYSLRDTESPLEWCSEDGYKVNILKGDKIYNLNEFKGNIYAKLRITISNK